MDLLSPKSTNQGKALEENQDDAATRASSGVTMSVSQDPRWPYLNRWTESKAPPTPPLAAKPFVFEDTDEGI